MKTELLRFFERGGLPMIVLFLLTIVVAVNLCVYFFVHQARFRAHEAASGGASRAQAAAQAAAPGEPVGGERDAALSPFAVSPEARPSTTHAAPAEAGADTEATRGATNASTTGEETAGAPRRAPADARRANAASLTEVTGGSLSAASTAAPAPSASAAQYFGSAAAVQYAASDNSPGDEAAENPMPEFPPQGMPPWMRQYLND